MSLTFVRDNIACSILLLVGLLAHVFTNGQPGEETYYVYSQDNGLPSNTVYKLFQDSKGLIWIATDAGVSSFDGKTFVTYTKLDGLPSSDVLDIVEDLEGRIWFETFEKSVSFYYQGKIYNPENTPMLAGVTTQIRNDSFYPKEDGIWIQGDSAYCFFTGDTVYRYHRKYLENQEFERNISTLMGKTDNGFLIYDRRGIYEHKGYDIDYKVKWLVDTARHILDMGDAIYYMDDNAIYRYKEGRQEKVYSPGAGGSIERTYFLTLRNSAPLWLGNYDGGASKLVEQNGKLVAKPLRLKYHFTHVLEDNEGNTWLGTQENGLLFFPRHGIRKVFESDSSQIFSCAYDEVKETLYIGLDKGKIACQGKRNYNLIQAECNSILGTNRVTSLLVAEGLWVGSDCFLGHYQKGMGIAEICDECGAIKDIVYQDGYIYVASSSGVFQYDIGDTNHMDEIYGERTYALAIDAGQVLAANHDHVFRLPDFKHPQVTFPPTTLPRKIAMLGDATVVGTYDDGIYIYVQDTTLHLTEVDYLLSNFCSDIAVENDSIFWYSSKGGVGRITFHQTGKLIHSLNLTVHEGLADNDVLDLELSMNQLFAVSHSAIVSIPLDIRDVQEGSSIFFSQIKIGNQLLVPGETIRLNAKHPPLEVSYRGVSYLNGPHLKYAYRLIGQSDEWLEVNENKLSFLSLPPGNYQLQVKLVDRSGDYPGEIAMLQLLVSPPIWQRPSFYIALIILLVVVFAAISYLVVRVIKQREEQKTLINSRIALSDLKALQAQMNPHFIYNSLTSIQHYIQVNDKENANKYLAKFAKLMRLVLDASRSSQVTLQDEIRLLDNYIELEKLRLGNSFRYEIEIDNQLKLPDIYVPPLFIQPFVENAIKHGISLLDDNKGELLLKFKADGELLLVTVFDNGKGVQERTGNGFHTSHSSDIIRDRIVNYNKLYGFDIKVVYASKEELKKRGTMVKIYLPLLAD